VAIVPSMAKGGLVVGAQSGRGMVSCRTATGWSAPAPISVAGGTLGAQLGYQSTDVVALVMNDTAKRSLEEGHFRIGVDASAAAGPVGEGRASSSDVELGGDILSYTRARGLFAGAELTGTSVQSDDDAARAIYGSAPAMRTILSGEVPAPDKAAVRFVSALQQAFPAQSGPEQSQLER
jgi:lipid-binding SYLF domain-containing protein